MSRYICVHRKISGKLFALFSQSLINLVFAALTSILFASAASAGGPLSVSPANPRYFIDSSGASVYLAGTYLTQDSVQLGADDYVAYLNFLSQNKHNFTRLWAWQQTPASATSPLSTLPYERTGRSLALDGGPKFDLSRLNQSYFDQLRARVVQAQQHGIYVSVVLFQNLNGSSKKKKNNPWTAHPFNRDNNVNGINGDVNGDGNGGEIFTAANPAVTSFQENYIRKVIDTLNDLDNVLYEINGDGPLGSAAWQYYIVNHLKSYEATKLKQHPVGLGYLFGTNSDIAFNSPADWVAVYNADLNPPVAIGDKVLFIETSPSLSGDRSSPQSIWKSFTRGFNVIEKEPDSLTPGVNESLHAAINQSRVYSEILHLSAIAPNATVCSTGYCLVNSGAEYLVYLPSGGGVVVDLSGIRQNFLVNWFNPISGETRTTTASGGSQLRLTSPFSGETVLSLIAQPQTLSQNLSSSNTGNTSSSATTLSSPNLASSSASVSTPTLTPNGGAFAGSVSVSLADTTAGAKIYYTLDGSTPTQSSALFSTPIIISSNVLLKAKAYKGNLTPSEVASAWFAKTNDFDFTLGNGGNVSLVAGSSASNVIAATLATGSSLAVSFTVSGLPSGTTANLSASSCSPTCSSTLTINTAGTTPVGTSTITVNGSGGGVNKSTTFSLTVSAPMVLTVATPTISPNGGAFIGSVAVTMATATSGGSIYYTTDGLAPTQSSSLYTGPINITHNATIRSKAFKNSYTPSSEASASFTSDLIAYWKLDEAAGTTATDSSGNGNTGTLVNGPISAPGVSGGALYFDGADDNVTVFDSPSLNPSNAFTASAWVNPATSSADFRAILVKNYTYYLYSSAAGYCGNGSVIAGFGEGATESVVCHPTQLAANAWTQLVLTYDGSKLTLYRNGIAVAVTAAAGAIPASTGPLQIGASQYGEFFNGLIDEVKVYNRALTATEIATAYQQSIPYNYAISSSGDLSVTAGSSLSNSISAALISGGPQPASFSISGLPSGATGSFSTGPCTPTCSTSLNITTSSTTPAGTSTVTVSSSSGGLNKTTAFNLVVNAPILPVATPTITPAGGNYNSPITVTIGMATPGASIYYTTDGSSPTQSSQLYASAMSLTSNATVKAKAFKTGYDPSAEALAVFTITPFDFTLSTPGNTSLIAGASTNQTVSATLVSGGSQSVSFSVSGLPAGSTGTFSSASCTPICSTVLTITTTGSTPAGSYPVTVTATGGPVIRSALFNLSVAATLVVATPAFTPDGGAFPDSVSVAIQTATAGAAIYYTMDGSVPTSSSNPYTGPMTLTTSATINAAAFKSGYGQSAMAASSFNVTSSSTTYYVAKNGNDAISCAQARTSTTPKLTIGAALACIGTASGAGAGRIVEVSAGTYAETIRNTLPSGVSWTNPFTLRAKSGDIVTIKASSESNIFLAGIGTPSMYSIIDGFALDGSNVSNNNITIAGPQFIRLKNLDIKNTANWSGIYTGMTQYLEVQNCKIHDGAYLPSGYGHGIYVEGSNNLIEGNEIYNLPAYGIHVYSSTNTPSNNTIRGNSVHDFGLQRATAAGILVTSGGSGNQVYSNKVYNGKGLYNDGGIGISVDRTSYSYVNGNTVYNNTWYGISAQSTTNSVIINNTLYQNGVNLITSGSVGGTMSGN